MMMRLMGLILMVIAVECFVGGVKLLDQTSVRMLNTFVINDLCIIVTLAFPVLLVLRQLERFCS